MKKPYRTHDEAMAELFRKDPAYAASYLTAVLEDGEQSEVLVALRHIVNSRSSIQKVAEQTELNANTLYRTLSPTGNPELRSLSKVLNAVGLKIAIEPI